jgi:hypothetical protein
MPAQDIYCLLAGRNVATENLRAASDAPPRKATRRRVRILAFTNGGFCTAILRVGYLTSSWRPTGCKSLLSLHLKNNFLNRLTIEVFLRRLLYYGEMPMYIFSIIYEPKVW